MINTKRLTLCVPYLALALALTAILAPVTASADSNSNWVYQGWESVKAGVNVDGAGNWYAWGSVWYDGQIVESDDHEVLWVKGELYRWDGSKAVICSQTDWFHPKDRGAWAIYSGTATGTPFPFPCGTGYYLARVWAYSRVWGANWTPVFHGGNLDTSWTWVTQP